MLKLNKLSTLVKSKKRRGRGGSRGGTSGKGHKGQKARSGGKVHPAFEGGQMTYVRRLPKRGFNNARFVLEVKTINVQRLNEVFEDGAVVDKNSLSEKGIFKGKKKFLLKVLGQGTLSKKLTVVADAFSKSAAKSIEDQGGQAQLIKER